MHSQEFIQKMQKRLEQEKFNVQSELKKDAIPETPMDNPDLDDLSQDATEDILEEKIEDTYEDIQLRIDNALAKIKQGTYGICEECGTEIQEEVLEQVPWAEYCANCNSNK